MTSLLPWLVPTRKWNTLLVPRFHLLKITAWQRTECLPCSLNSSQLWLHLGGFPTPLPLPQLDGMVREYFRGPLVKWHSLLCPCFSSMDPYLAQAATDMAGIKATAAPCHQYTPVEGLVKQQKEGAPHLDKISGFSPLP